MDKLKNMVTYVTIAEQGSLSAAANQLDCSVATVTRALAELEAYLGIRLINRSTRSLAITEEGRDYLQHCRRILADIQTLESQLDQRKTTPTGKLSVTAPVMFGRMHLAPLIEQWLTEYSDLTAELILLDRSVELLEEGFDLALRIEKLDDSSLVAVPLGEVSRVCCASPELIRRYGTPSQPQQLTDWPAIANVTEGTHWQFQTEGAIQRIKINPILTCNHIDPIVDAAIRGLGVAYLRSYQIVPYLRSGQLVTLLQPFTLPTIPVQFVFPHNRLLAPRVRTFIDWATPKLRQLLSSALEQ